ncbi:MAG: Druantia anti-phage system protein DruA [bacterium]
MKYSGREFTSSELEHIRSLIADHPDLSRAALSRRVCEELNWRRPDGGLKDMRCRVVMLKMQDDGLLTLPPARHRRSAPGQKIVWDPDTEPCAQITSPIVDLLPLSIRIVTSKDSKASLRHNTFIHRYHYLGYKSTPGANIRYSVNDRSGRELAVLTWGAAAWRTAPRDEWIGWGQQQRERKLHLVVNNTRFLILPWVQCKNLASHILGKMVRRLPLDWDQRYGYRPVLAETFVDAVLYTGHCYRVSNWARLGQTTGRTKWNKSQEEVANRKDVWVYPLAKKAKLTLIS